MSLLTVNTAELRTIQVNDTIAADLTIPQFKSAMIVGPVTVDNITVNGNLNVISEVDITNTLTIGTSGKINLVG